MHCLKPKKQHYNAIPVLPSNNTLPHLTLLLFLSVAQGRNALEHVVIEHKPTLGLFELTILSPNAAMIDRSVFIAGEHVPVMEGSTIEIMGTRLTFLEPAKEERKGEDPMHLEGTLHTTVKTKTKVIPKQPVPKQPVPKLIPKCGSAMIATCTPLTVAKIAEIKDTVVHIPLPWWNSRKSSMTAREIASRIKGVSIEEITAIVVETVFIGCIKRTGKTADGSPKEDLYYYQSEQDPDQERRKQYSQMGRGARKCTMKDAQYFFRIPPKLPNHRSKAYVPPPASTLGKRKKTHQEESIAKIPVLEPILHAKEKEKEKEKESDDDFGSSSGGEISDQEVSDNTHTKEEEK
ncbi:hypothetical protein BDF14DRAFT_1744844 [Spinellus fusiger]|nr:hypothetical protein BDF14DRAFT_1744844 [Spinellus fusiger]